MSNNKDIKKGNIYYADLPMTFGSEQGGYRPVLIIQNDIGNKYSPTTLVAPFTSNINKKNLPTHVIFDAKSYSLKRDSKAMFEQVRVLDKSLLKEFIANIDDAKMAEVNNAIEISFGLSPAWYIIKIFFKFLKSYWQK